MRRQSSALWYLCEVRGMFSQSWAVLTRCVQAMAEYVLVRLDSRNCAHPVPALVSVPAPSGYAFVISPCSSVCTRSQLDRRHPPEPQCSYDPVDGLPLAPDADPMERIRALEQELCWYISIFNSAG
jgi:hypothetical protein